ncbi:MAG: PepSY domain-containing protein [Epulopiscium sp.]|nr:PepSY domain-containing protein [Candidatus Epulonipiscium sp.]
MKNLSENIKITPSQALDVYVERYPNTTVKKVKLKAKSNSFVYEIKGYDNERKYEIYVSPMDGTIIQVKEKLLKGSHRQITRESTDKVDQAIDRAIKDIGKDSRIYEWSLELDDGSLEFIVKARTEDDKKIKYGYNLDTGEMARRK